MEEPGAGTTAAGRAGTGAPTVAGTEWVGAALLAAEAGDPVGMLEALHKSRFLDGLVGILRGRWRDLDEDECHTVVGKAVDAFYEKASRGERIREPEAFLYKVSMNIASDDCAFKGLHTQFDDEVHRASLQAPPGVNREQLRSRALTLARGLLPQLGQENLQRVMAYYLDAVEKGVEHISADEVADALNLSRDTVRQCKSRGFRRLRRVAREQGIKLTLADEPESDFQDYEREEETDERQ